MRILHKSNYNLLSSLLKIDDIIDFAKTKKLPSIAITDSNMFGTMEFIKKCEKEKSMKEKVKDVMKFSGPRLLIYRPVDFFRHLIGK